MPYRRGMSNKVSIRKQPTPIISRTLPDGTLIEALYDRRAASTRLAVAAPGSGVSVVPYFDLATGERLVPYSPDNNLLEAACVLLPSDIGDFRDKGDVLEDIRTYLHRYVDLSPLFEDIAAYYVLLTWVYDAFSELPYLRFRGDYGTGKSRALITIGSICYKPFFASGASTVSPIFHVLDTFGGTLILDEADFRFSDATADLTKILNNGNMRGLPVLRTMTNKNQELNPRAFRVFGPKIIGMRESFADCALESRFLTEDTGKRPLRSDIPIHLPESLHTDALVLRNRLLAWRFHARYLVGPNASRVIEGIEPRLNQTALALLSLVDDADLRQRIRDELVGEEARVLQERASTYEATMLSCVMDGLEGASSVSVSVADITRRFNQKMQAEFGKPMSPKWVGGILRNKLKLTTLKSGGTYIVPCTERSKVQVLAKRYGVVRSLSPGAHL